MKKVLVVHHSGLLGGAGISLYYTIKYLSEFYEVNCYIPETPAQLSSFFISKNININKYNFKNGSIPYYNGGHSITSPRFWYHVFRSFLSIKYWKNIIEKENPDIFIVNSKVMCWMGHLFKDRKTICFVRETMKGKSSNLINRIIFKMLDNFSLIFFLSEYDLQQTNTKYTKKIVVPDFLDHEEHIITISREEACRRIAIDPEKFNVLFVGGINELKGIDLAVEAINEIKNDNIRLIVAGNIEKRKYGAGIKEKIKKILQKKNNKFRSHIFKYIHLNNISKYINFIGLQSDMDTVYNACDILIFPMKEPHQSRPLFEIGMQRKTAILPDFPNIREFLHNNVNGLVFEPDNHKDLAEKIVKLYEDEILRKRLGNENYNFTMNFHSKEKCLNIILKEINKLAGDNDA
jgi:glycosyltransferase involved in cell wall biosynthesis